MRAKRRFAWLAIAVAGFAAVAALAADGAPPTDGKPAQPNAAPVIAPKEPAPPPSVTVIGARDAHGVLGRDVRSPTDEDMGHICLLYTSDAADEEDSVDLGGRRL